MRCPVHPRYKVKRQPTSGCKMCWRIWRTRDSQALATTMLFDVGQKVLKYTGDYTLPGEVRARFTTKAGNVRYVVEHEPGFLHIYSEHNLRLLEPSQSQS